ncbi:MAG: hypothetical protein V4515_00015 [Chloroflexota bacterium]
MNPWELKPDPHAPRPPAPAADSPPVGLVLSPERAADLRRLVRDVSHLSRCTTLDRTTDPRRVLPIIAPALLWRVLPRLLESAADLATGMPGRLVSPGEAAFMAELADAIETGAAAPTIAPHAPAAPVGVSGDGI